MSPKIVATNLVFFKGEKTQCVPSQPYK